METSGTESAAPAPAPEKHRNPWIWISAVLAIAAIGLLVWALTVRSDLDDTNAELDQVQAQVQENTDSGSDFAAAAKAAYDDLASRIGAAGEDAQANIEEAQAEVEQAQTEADEATGRASVAVECAKAYFSAFGALFESGGVAAVREQISGITDDCQAALSGS